MTTDTVARPIEILLVEDNPGDVRLTKEALKEDKVRNNLHVVGDGMDALSWLRREGDYAESPRPDIILLDLLYELWSVLDEGYLTEAGLVKGHSVSAGGDGVGVDVVAELPRSHRYPLGSVMAPLRAEAATVAGEPR